MFATRTAWSLDLVDPSVARPRDTTSPDGLGHSQNFSSRQHRQIGEK
jgi:hypothetical protein